MTVGERRPPPDFDEFLARAVDRQVAAHKAIAEALFDLRETVRESSGSEAIEALLESNAAAIEDLQRSIRDLAARTPEPLDLRETHKLVRETVQAGTASVRSDVRELHATITPGLKQFTDISRTVREALAPGIARTEDIATTVRRVSEDIGAVRDAVGGVSADIEGIAQALIDMNGGLRNWAEGVDRNLASIRQSVERVKELADESREILGDERTAPPALPAEPQMDLEPLVQRVESVADRVNETAELSTYLADQVDALDRVLGRVGDLPMKLEGVVTQALRRTLATRAKLDKEAERSLDDVLTTLDEQLGQLEETLNRFTQSEEHLRKLELGQVDLTSRMESLQETLLDRLETLETSRRRNEEALARAIDRASAGKSAGALDGLVKPSVRKAKAKAKTKSTSRAKSSRTRARRPRPSGTATTDEAGE